MAQHLLANYQPEEARQERRRRTDQHAPRYGATERRSEPERQSVISPQISHEQRQREGKMERR